MSDARGRRVLIIDDDADVRDSLQVLLELEGVDVLAAANGVDGLELARTRQPDLVLLDLMMPGMSGEDVLDAMAEDPVLRELPTVVVSARSDPNPGGRRVTGVLRKPFELAALIQVIARHART